LSHARIHEREGSSIFNQDHAIVMAMAIALFVVTNGNGNVTRKKKRGIEFNNLIS